MSAIQVNVRASEEEVARWKKAAHVKEWSLSKFVRDVLNANAKAILKEV